MGRSTNSSTVCFCLLLVLFLHRRAMCVVITVGDSLGWTNFDLSTQRVPDYAAWAASQPVASGDSVVFRYAPGFHNVAMLPSKADFDNCNFAKATMLDTGSSGNFTWIAPEKTGAYYFACGFSVEGQGTHCDGGQKVTISVGVLAAAPPLALSPTPAGLVLAPGLPPSSPSSSPSPGGGPTGPAASPGMGLVPAIAPATSESPSTSMAPSGSSGASAAVPIEGSEQDNTSGGDSLVTWWRLIVASTVVALRLL
ncbi:hypothetical protein SELMODRAFT_415061 [Selaginella moellendorffii]|uniref:Phytocyanin domain-containing protein n=1 Tax=Selaginella moellendorffii TaxID=88036 RepID=D8RUI1_SELML|nr:cucumber peeling cupredoxin [Selaginella moellendorffii]EFJ24211.1 hypothetical protein SELMODRAFT_415061 [Selaginella moellendorffii]|eukprot:XP_002974691.1 cucumber peeling cupredoxin [Selaginella moellendorffii]